MEMERTRLVRSNSRSATRLTIRSTRCENMTLCLSNIFLMYFLILGLAILGSGVFGRAHFAAYNIRDLEVTILEVWICVGGFLAMCCQSQSLLVLVIFLFIALACIEIAVCAVSLYTNSHARTFLNHLWEISSHDFRLYIEDEWVCCGLFNFTDRTATPCPDDGSVRACYPLLLGDVNTLLVIVFCCSLALVISKLVFVGAMWLLVYILRGKNSKAEVPLLRTAAR